MSTRIRETFARASASGKKILVAYLCVGDPSAEESVELALACVTAGADVLELGVPFSDPTADGPSIARASQRSILRGGGLLATLGAARAIRARTNAPLILFGYYNPLLVRGEAKVVDEAHAAGIDALLVVDLPVDEPSPLRELASAKKIAIVPLLAPTSSPARVAAVKASQAKWDGGFVYYVSVTGVTGSDGRSGTQPGRPLEEASANAAKLGAAIGLPIVVGFGIDSPDKARAAAAGGADGVVVGTAIVRRIEEGTTRDERIASVRKLVGDLRAALDAPR